MIMPSVPGPEGFSEDRGVLRSLLSALAFDSARRAGLSKHKQQRNSSHHHHHNKKKKRLNCLGRIMPCQDDAKTVDENESTTELHHPSCQFSTDVLDQLHLHQRDNASIIDPSFVDIFYDSKDRHAEEACMDEDLIPIGLEPDDSVMLESFELCFRPDESQRLSNDSSTLRHYQVPLECAEDGSLSASCSSLSVSACEGPPKAVTTTQKTTTTTPTTPEKKEADKDALPLRFLRAGKGDEVEGQRRYKETLQWRKDNNIDNALYQSWPKFEVTKRHYPHFFHCTGRNGQPVFYEQPPKTDLRALRNEGVSLEQLLKHYAMITEFQWQVVERDDFQRSIYIIDLQGIRMTDFVGECVDFVRQASAFSAAHYPERAGHVFVVNVPGWFKMIWNVVKPMVDEVTLEKVHILRGKEEIFEALLEQIPLENIPQEYGGQSCYKLGESPEEGLLRDWMQHNNDMAQGQTCRYIQAGEGCRFCNFTLARNY